MDSSNVLFDPVLQQLLDARKAFQEAYPHLSPQDVEEQSMMRSTSAMAPEASVPRSLSTSTFNFTAPTSQSDIRHAISMNRNGGHSAPPALAVSHGKHQRAALSPNAPNNYEFSSTQNLRKRRRIDGQLQDIPEFLANVQNNYEDVSPTYSPNMSDQMYHDSGFLSTSQFGWSTASSSPINTPNTALTTISSQEMSRNGSVISHLSFANDSVPVDRLAMMRMHSDISQYSQSPSHSETPIGAQALNTPFVHDVARSYSTSHVIPSPQRPHKSQRSSVTFTSSDAFASSSQSLAPSMKRSDSSQSNSSDLSSQSLSRSARRQHEVSQSAQRSILPKESDTYKPVKMARVKSEDGSYKDKAMIPKDQLQYKRPQHPKLFCPYCRDHQEGFRGDHELQRHVNRSHSQRRKVWVCVDASPDGKWLENCKACRTKKRYGAYYNAAAHLRRAHFNPRKRGRKAKNDAEKRGGKGGGNWPPMEELKEHWICELEEEVTEHSEPLNDNSAEVDEGEIDAEYSGDVEHATAFTGIGFDASAAAANVSNLVPTDLTFDGTAATVDNMIDQQVMFESSVDPFSNSSYDMHASLTSHLISQATGMSNFSNTFDDVFHLDGSYQAQPQTGGYEESLGSVWV